MICRRPTVAILFTILSLFGTKGKAEQVATLGPQSQWVEQEKEGLLQRLYPFYFAYGQPLSKLQLSFKTPIVRTWPLYFGYTQIMFWALREHSKPFRDLTYSPELFYRFTFAHPGIIKALDFSPWSHASNGKDGEASRSYNQAYVRLRMEKEFPAWIARVSIQLSDLYNLDSTNRDIQDYIGPLTLRLSFIQLYDSWIDQSELSVQAKPGGKFANRWDLGGYQFSWSFRLGGIDIVPAFYLQYYTGYAETLLNYNRHENVFRVGFIF